MEQKALFMPSYYSDAQIVSSLSGTEVIPLDKLPENEPKVTSPSILKRGVLFLQKEIFHKIKPTPQDPKPPLESSNHPKI